MDSPSIHPMYDKARIAEYLNHVRLSHDEIRDPHESAQRAEGKLLILQQHHLAVVSFENLSLHYSPHHSVDLHPDYLYDKIVRKGRGGYCMENNCFFGIILRSLGYTVYSAGGRVHEEDGQYTSWSHMVNIVTLADGQLYLVDVGFGNNGPTRPLPMIDMCELPSIAPASMRLVRGKIPATVNPSDRLWIYQHRNSFASEYEPMYCFTETEFLPRDYEMMNFWTSHSRKSFFTYRILCVKKLMDEQSHDLIGTLILSGAEVKRRIGNETELLKVCKTEEERIEVLETMFGVTLTGEEKSGIDGMVTQLPRTIVA